MTGEPDGVARARRRGERRLVHGHDHLVGSLDVREREEEPRAVQELELAPLALDPVGHRLAALRPHMDKDLAEPAQVVGRARDLTLGPRHPVPAGGAGPLGFREGVGGKEDGNEECGSRAAHATP